MVKVKDMMIDIIRAGVCGCELKTETKNNVTDENLVELFNISAKLDVVQIVAEVLLKNDLIENDEIKDIYKESLMQTVLKVEQIKYDFCRVCEVFEENGIPHIPLKGAVIRELYPEPWMRNSCDVDILIKPCDLERTIALLSENFNCSDFKKNSCDVAMSTESGVHIELHYNLLDKDILKNGKYLRKWDFDLLSDIWETAEVFQGKKYRYVMNDELFYCYHFAHMAKHFENGGCGVKAIIDLWVLDNMKEYDRQKREEYLEKTKLLSFYKHISELCRVWFADEEKNDTTEALENYILSGGAYGNVKNKVTFGSGKAGNNSNFLKYRIFASVDILRYYYPKIDEKKWIMPFCQIGRWIKIIKAGRLKNSVNEIMLSKNVSTDDSEFAKILAEKLGL